MSKKFPQKKQPNQKTNKAMLQRIKPFAENQFNTLEWQYLEAYFYESLRSQPIIADLLDNAPLHIVVLSVYGSNQYYLGAYAGESSFHPHNHVLKCHMLQACLALELITEEYFFEEINIDCGQLRRLFAIEPALLINCAKTIRAQTSHH